MGFAADVGDPDGLREVIDAAVAELGGLSILYNNAGIGTFSTASTRASRPSGTVCSGST